MEKRLFGKWVNRWVSLLLASIFLAAAITAATAASAAGGTIENAIFPMADMTISQGYGSGTYSHENTYAIAMLYSQPIPKRCHNCGTLK